MVTLSHGLAILGRREITWPPLGRPDGRPHGKRMAEIGRDGRRSEGRREAAERAAGRRVPLKRRSGFSPKAAPGVFFPSSEFRRAAVNMPYCRFQNTLRDLGDCFANLATLNPEDRSFNEDEERDCRRELILTCARILQEIGVGDPFDEFEVLACVEKLDEMFEPEAEE